jgi:hypothetical protein|tara:strand:- start:764 stop:1195 length:432 start_codon:yes stop_codon:yes gene_type:complete
MDYVIKSEYDRRQAIKRIESGKIPFTMSVIKGKHRTVLQNSLQRKWLLEAQEQGDMTAEEYRGYCKLHFAVPILRAENEQFCEVYDRLIRPMDYEKKIEMMMVPMDLPCTRIMSTEQKTRYLDAMRAHFESLGFVLTIPKGSQ